MRCKSTIPTAARVKTTGLYPARRVELCQVPVGPVYTTTLPHAKSPSLSSVAELLCIGGILIMALSVGSALKLSSGKTIQQYGFGSPPKDKTYESMLSALRLGVRHGESLSADF